MQQKTGAALEDVATEPFLCTISGASAELDLSDRIWDDGSYIFCGYHTRNDLSVIIAGQRVPVQVEIVPDGAPERTNPFSASIQKGENTVRWYENAMGTLSSAFIFLREFEEKRGFLLDGTLNGEIGKYYNHEDLTSQLDTFSSVLRDNTLTFSRKVSLLAPVLTSIRRILEINRIPDHLKYEESLFYLNVLKLQEHVQWLIEETDKTQEDIIPDFRLIAEHLADVLKEIKDDHENVARGRQPVPDAGEKAAILEMLEEMAKIMDMKKGSRQAMQHIGQELELAQKIWSTPSIDWQTRLDAATHAVDLISDAIARVDAAAVESRKRHAVIPDLSRYVEEINQHLAALDETGYTAITAPVAGHFLSGINEARKAIGKPALTKEELAATLKINSLFISLAEKDGALSTSIHLYLADNDYAFALFCIYVLLRDGKIHEMKPVGKQGLSGPECT